MVYGGNTFPKHFAPVVHGKPSTVGQLPMQAVAERDYSCGAVADSHRASRTSVALREIVDDLKISGRRVPPHPVDTSFIFERRLEVKSRL